MHGLTSFSHLPELRLAAFHRLCFSLEVIIRKQSSDHSRFYLWIFEKLIQLIDQRVIFSTCSHLYFFLFLRFENISYVWYGVLCTLQILILLLCTAHCWSVGLRYFLSHWVDIEFLISLCLYIFYIEKKIYICFYKNKNDSSCKFNMCGSFYPRALVSRVGGSPLTLFVCQLV